MLANSPVLFPSPAGGINSINGDDDDFGDFVFSSPSSSHTPSFPYSTPTTLSTAAENDEEWGDFVASQLGSHPLQPQSSSPSSPPLDPLPPSSKAWVKPNGAIPLSIFGEEEEEEEETDPVEMESSGIFENGFGSYSLSNYSSSRPATAGKLNDLLEKLYGHVDVGGKEEGDDFDEGSWEFKDAMPSDARLMMEEGGGVVIGLEILTAANENGRSQVFVNRLENGYKDMEQFNMDGQKGGLADHEKLTNRPLGHNHSVTDKALHDMLPSFENGTLGSGTNGSKIEFPEYATINGFMEKIQGDQTELLHSTEEQKDIKEVEWNMWDFDDLNISAYANGKKNLYGNPEDHIEHNTGAGKMDYSPVALTSIIQNLYEKTDSPRAALPSQNSVNNGQEVYQLGKSSADVNADMDFDQFDWEFQNTAEIGEVEKIDAYESDQGHTNESTSYTLVDVYCRLKEESLSLIVHHLAVLKVHALPGATPEVKKINEKIQEADGNLQEIITSDDTCIDKQIPSSINKLLNVMRTSNFRTVDQECHLSERLLAAEKHLNAAVDLFEHSSSVLQILRLASTEQQLFYINAWSKLASACAEELQLGAKIWTESLEGNISKQILNRGNKYFLALGEIYRILKILKATVRVYMPWLLSNLENSNDMVACLEKGNEAWINSGLEEALRSISSNMDLDDKDLAKPLLESIHLIDNVNVPTFQDTASQHNNRFCKFSLLPLDKLPGIKTAVWNGDYYITKIANLWANRISPDPPELPSLMPILFSFC